MVANVGVKRPPGRELGQRWRLWHRTGHRWIEKCNMNVLVAIRDRTLSWAGLWKEPCTDGCASGTVGTDAGAYVLAVKGCGREWFGVHLVPLSRCQAKGTVLVTIGRVQMA